jgi:hypothetical protein
MPIERGMQTGEKPLQALMSLCRKAIGVFLLLALVSVAVRASIDSDQLVGAWRIVAATTAGITAVAVTAVVGASAAYLVLWWQSRSGQ